MKLPKINWSWVFIFVVVGMFTRFATATYFAEHFDMPSSQQKATNCPDGTRTTTGACLMVGI